jgi:hypothetical protein
MGNRRPKIKTSTASLAIKKHNGQVLPSEFPFALFFNE